MENNARTDTRLVLSTGPTCQIKNHSGIMYGVVIALLPALAASIYFFRFRALWLVALRWSLCAHGTDLSESKVNPLQSTMVAPSSPVCF